MLADDDAPGAIGTVTEAAEGAPTGNDRSAAAGLLLVTVTFSVVPPGRTACAAIPLPEGLPTWTVKLTLGSSVSMVVPRELMRMAGFTTVTVPLPLLKRGSVATTFAVPLMT